MHALNPPLSGGLRLCEVRMSWTDDCIVQDDE